MNIVTISFFIFLLLSLFNFTPCAAHRARPFSTSFATRRMSNELIEALRRHLRADRAHAVADLSLMQSPTGGSALVDTSIGGFAS